MQRAISEWRWRFRRILRLAGEGARHLAALFRGSGGENDVLIARIVGNRVSGIAYAERFHEAECGTVVDFFVDGRHAGSVRATGEEAAYARNHGEGYRHTGFAFVLPDHCCDGGTHLIDVGLRDGRAKPSGFPVEQCLRSNSVLEGSSTEAIDSLLVNRPGEVTLCRRFPAVDPDHCWERRIPIGFEEIPEELRREFDFGGLGTMRAHRDELIRVKNAIVIRDGPILLEDRTIIGESLGAGHTRRAGAEPEYHRMLMRGDVPQVDEPAAFIQRPGMGNYFHWLIESLPRTRVLAEAREDCPDLLCFLVKKGKGLPPHARRSLDRELPAGMEVRLIESEICRFRELVLPVSYHTVPLAATRYQRSSIDFLRERRRAFGLDRALDGKGRRFLLSRADASRRRIRNEDALVEGLAKLGFERLVCKEHGDEEVIAILSSAEVVVGMHGANLTNIVHCRPGTLVIELVTPSFCGHLRYYWDLAEICAMDYGVVFVPEEGAAMSSEELRLRDACVDVDCVCERIEERMRRAGDEDRDS